MYCPNIQDRFDTPVKLAGLLDDIPVTIIVIDDQILSAFRRPYQESSKKTRSESEQWELTGHILRPRVESRSRIPYTFMLGVRSPPLPSLRLRSGSIG